MTDNKIDYKLPIVLKELNREDTKLAAAWMQKKKNYKWFDFGNGRQSLSYRTLAVMVKGKSNYIRMYYDSVTDTPIGIIGITGISSVFRTGMLWAIRGNFCKGPANVTKLAASLMILNAFKIYELNSITAWAVEGNVKSLAIIKQMGFQYIGCQRKCHVMNGKTFSRLHFDLLPEELVSDTDLSIIYSRLSNIIEGEIRGDEQYTEELRTGTSNY